MGYIEKITKEQLEDHLKGICGIQISDVWIGYAHALFLECGELKEEFVGSKKQRHLVGQVTFMLECDWYLENKHCVFCEWGNSDDEIKKQTAKLIGCQICDISLIGLTSELSIELDDEYLLKTVFEKPDTYPHWNIGFRDLDKISVRPEWKEEDVSVWLSYEENAFRRSFCFDDETFQNQKFLIDYCKKDRIE
ncbi:MAG: hypothetical protein ACYTET_02175 [Planctomycetota bacterium]